jgi:AcrR family transcriptional regulator
MERGLPRRERQKLYHRQQILDTALDLFSRHGYHNVSMHRIAEESEFSIGTLYNFFKDKEDLYRGLILDFVRVLEDHLNRALDEPGDEVSRITGYIHAKGRLFMNNVPMLKIYFSETRGGSFDIKAGLDMEVRGIYDKFILRVSSVFRGGIDNGIFRPLIDPYYMAVILESVTNSFLFLWLENPSLHPYEQNVENFINLFFMNIINRGG